MGIEKKPQDLFKSFPINEIARNKVWWISTHELTNKYSKVLHCISIPS